METPPTDAGDELSASEASNTRMVEEIARLRRQLEQQETTRELREALVRAAAAGTIAAPISHTRLLELIVETAAHVISARSGALFLIDEEAEELIFEVALGPKASEVKRLRVPLGHGIAGLVAVTGQPMAISDAQSDPRQAADIARSVGYTPQNILCVPLLVDDEVIGVLELLDKTTSPSFTTRDMEVLGMFARQAGVAIEQSRTQQSVGRLMTMALRAARDASPERQARLEEQARSFAESIEEDPASRRALELAGLVQEITHHGASEAELCRTILQGFLDYLRSRPTMGALD